MELKVSEESLGLSPICVIKEHMDRIFGKDLWREYDLESISLDLNLVMDELLRDKITLLQILEHDSDLFYSDVLFFLHATEVMNNKVADFESLPYPNSLEIAYAIHEMQRTFPGEFQYPVKKAVTYLLKDEGYSEAVGIFNDIAFKNELSEGQESSDTTNKLKAITAYIKSMDNDY